MRQKRFQLAELLGNGLLKNNPGGVNQKGFLELMNLRPLEGQLVYVDRYDGIDFEGTAQAFTTGVGNFLCTDVGIYKIVNGELADLFGIEEQVSIWTCADFSAFAIFSNGRDVIFASAEGLYKDAEISAKIPMHQGVAAVGGQAVVWDNDLVRWSRINNLDFSLSNDNESGYHNPQIGVVHSCIPFNKGFLALGDRGVAKYIPSGVTFSYKKIHSIGVTKPLQATSAGDVAFFVDNNGDFTVIKDSEINITTAKAEPTTAIEGYRWLLKAEDIRLFYSDLTKEVWIQNSNGNFVYTGKELYQISLCVAGIYIESGQLRLVKKSGEQTEAAFTTTKLDFGIAGLKTVSEVYVQDSGKQAAETSIKVYSPKERNSKKRKETYAGVSYPHITGDVMAVRRTVAAYQPGSISNLHIQTIRVDGRSGLGYAGE